MMYCSYCGKALVDDAAFCYACGKRVAIPDWDAELADPSGTAGSQGGDGRAFTTLQDFLRRLLQGLPEPDRKILEMRFWLDEDSSYTMDEICESLNVTREEILRAEANALRLLKPLAGGK